MLVINPDWAITSERGDWAPFPYVPLDFRGQVQNAKAFLRRSASSDQLVSVLIREMAGLSHAPALRHTRPSSVIDAAANLIALGSIIVAESLRSAPRLTFSTDDPKAKDPGRGVIFAREQIAAAILERWLIDPTASAAVAAAQASQPAADRQQPEDSGSAASWLASQLMLRRLGLFPVNGDTTALRLAWIEHHLATRILDAPPPPPPPAAPQQAAAPAQASTVPDLPAEISAQAQTLIDAAEAGVPFCEECARAAAERAYA